jgi:two-component system nitrate/nitrite response regulator NarL
MKFLIVDDHPVVRDGVAALLRSAGPDTEVLQACDSSEGLRIVDARHDLDAVFLDLSMPGLGGVPALQEFGKRRPDLPVIVLSSSEDPSDVRSALAAGALGYVPKSASAQTLLAALQLVLSGNVYVPPLLLDARARGGAETQSGADAAQLTERQIDVLRQLSRGLTNKEIANRLGISEKTIKAHMTAIFKMLNVSNRTQAVTAARQAELI